MRETISQNVRLAMLVLVILAGLALQKVGDHHGQHVDCGLCQEAVETS